jgi:predicted ATP-grasp superfamily ATP-dependent carboligase
LAAKVVAESGFHGLGGFDWIIDPEDNLPRLIELHPRPPSGFGLGKWAGVSFARAIASLLDLKREKLQAPDPSKFSPKPYCCYFPDHPKFVLQNRAWSEMRQWLPGSRARTWSMLPWDDPAIFLAMLGKVPGSYGKRR